MKFTIKKANYGDSTAKYVVYYTKRGFVNKYGDYSEDIWDAYLFDTEEAAQKLVDRMTSADNYRIHKVTLTIDSEY